MPRTCHTAPYTHLSLPFSLPVKKTPSPTRKLWQTLTRPCLHICRQTPPERISLRMRKSSLPHCARTSPVLHIRETPREGNCHPDIRPRPRQYRQTACPYRSSLQEVSTMRIDNHWHRTPSRIRFPRYPEQRTFHRRKSRTADCRRLPVSSHWHGHIRKWLRLFHRLWTISRRTTSPAHRISQFPRPVSVSMNPEVSSYAMQHRRHISSPRHKSPTQDAFRTLPT